MKGNQELVDALNGLLASELTSINQYYGTCRDGRGLGLHPPEREFQEASITEMKHADAHERISALEVSSYSTNDMYIRRGRFWQVNK